MRWFGSLFVLGFAILTGCSAHDPHASSEAQPRTATPAFETDDAMNSIDPALVPQDVASLTDADWRRLLSPEEYRILRQAGTEYPGTGRYLESEDKGDYHCAGCAQRLYTSNTKFHSGCGWPSFFEEVEPGAISLYRDTSHGMIRTEMRCSNCDGHLGHVFEDGPPPTGLRHCVNGTALIFVPEGADPLATLSEHRRTQQPG